MLESQIDSLPPAPGFLQDHRNHATWIAAAVSGIPTGVWTAVDQFSDGKLSYSGEETLILFMFTLIFGLGLTFVNTQDWTPRI
ncbi:hypothetical protein A3H89_02175 [Candidatus Amesbacteria bacterium RIFCSPLOWO2_02_FULL_48_11]|uniref:Uncharacterized protein n=3 Tax=Patescibacteria group TaxID=1783273 RepID=A0A1F4Z433_9BACT|nr:MAG: hypothetical protein UY33_C0008G0023 [Candidatus Amesbacteria bacterium GW2011_GWA1_48_9]OGC91214.1 MAG: hypothetical protein A2V48_03670 [Candidatus Amesbacteria bacterium RBG_19FT_COMBO_48_16]OGC95161.1 MAG: hypothetical protein A3C34_01375 [Candidatus Amesbacteria bacterium RIFCSPHIGHO2_02_FULL_48_21]OGC99433.1 MAG: hypothetical protein A2W16_02815 [Candidatus Amesbacteria bacterium RBG_16_48_31]OGD01015.1 MAG: hypothetical protein A3E17_02140 [Candidatus Amesbacteria bacterium RIFCS